MTTYKIIDYHTRRTIADKLPTLADAEKKRDELLKEKIKHDKDYTDYNWLLLIEPCKN